MNIELIPVPYEGWFAVIVGGKVIGAFEKYSDAWLFTEWKCYRRDEFTISTITKNKE